MKIGMWGLLKFFIKALFFEHTIVAVIYKPEKMDFDVVRWNLEKQGACDLMDRAMVRLTCGPPPAHPPPIFLDRVNRASIRKIELKDMNFIDYRN